MRAISKDIFNIRKVRVKDAFKQDAGRGIVRLDPILIKDLNLKSGDVIEIRQSLYNKKTAAILMSGKSEDEGKNVIRVDPS
ncbi:MAG: hypothetical protein ACFE8P_17440, partial [Promethearchaeota archaeon]